jgi:hypothetical protein
LRVDLRVVAGGGQNGVKSGVFTKEYIRERLEEVVVSGDWRVLPEVRKRFLGGDLGLKGMSGDQLVVAAHLAYVVALTRNIHDGTDPDWLGEVREFVYKDGWDPQKPGAVEALVNFRPRGTVVELEVSVEVGGNEADIVCADGFMVRHWSRAEVPKGKGKAIKRLTELVKRDGLETVLIKAISLEGYRTKLAVLKALGVLAPDLPWEQFAAKLGLDVTSLYDGVGRGLPVLMEKGEGCLTMGDIGGMAGLLKVVSESLVGVKARWTGDRWSETDDLRAVVVKKIGRLSDDRKADLYRMLLPKERQRLEMMLKVGVGGEMVPLRRLSSECGGMATGVFKKVLRTIDDLLEGKTRRFIGSNGLPIKRNMYPTPILLLLSKLEGSWDEVMIRLTPLQKALVEFVRVPDENGWYPTMADVKVAFDGRSTNWPVYFRQLVVDLKAIIKEKELQ